MFNVEEMIAGYRYKNGKVTQEKCRGREFHSTEQRIEEEEANVAQWG